MFKLLLTLFLWFFCSNAHATSYYVDCAGNNSNNGTSSGTPFKSFAAVTGIGFLQPDDIVNVKTGCTFTNADSESYINSSGSFGHPITIQTYGGGADPIFDASVDPAVDVPGWAGWDVYDASNHIYVSHANVPWTVKSINVDGTSSLRMLAYHVTTNANNETLTTLQKQPCSFARTGSGAPIYIRMCDDTDPNGHALRFGRYGNGSDSGHARGQFGINDNLAGYVNVSHIILKGSNAQGWGVGSPYCILDHVKSFASARESLYVVMNATRVPNGAHHITVTNSDFGWSSSDFGQNVTVESNHGFYYNNNVHNGWMAGFDILDYNGSTDASFNLVYHNIMHDNGQRAWNKNTNGFDPAGIYNDGGHDNVYIDNELYASDSRFNIGGANPANAIKLFSIGTEHPNSNNTSGSKIPKPAYNVYLINNYLHNIPYMGIAIFAIYHSNSALCTPAICNVNENIWFVGNTIDATGAQKVFGLGNLKADGRGVFMYDNIFKMANQSAQFGTPSLSTYHSDYNLFFGGSGGVIYDGGYTLAGWQAFSGTELHSVFANPLLISTTNAHLSNTLAGQASNSGALNVGLDPNNSAILSNMFKFTSIGSTRTDDVLDSTGSYDIGYHYLLGFNTTWATWFVRSDGSTITNCDGVHDAAYPGSGTGQPCAVSSLYEILAHDTDDTGVSSGTTYIGPGDTVIIGDPAGGASFPIGLLRSAVQSGCSTGYPYGCHLMPLVSGADLTHPTTIKGRPDLTGCSSKTQLYGTQGSKEVINLTGMANIELDCLEITDHSTCGFRVGSNQCPENYPNDVGDYGRYGIYGKGGTNWYLNNLTVHGMAYEGINAGGLKDIISTNVNVDGSYFAGWDFDVGESGSESYNSGNLIFNNVNIRYNGYQETYPRTGGVIAANYSDATDENDGGYGDGLATYITGGNWFFFGGSASHNVEDGTDLLYHDGNGNLVYDKFLAEGNTGNQIKVQTGLDLENSVIVGNCTYVTSAGITHGAGFTTCRAGGDAIVIASRLGKTYKLYGTSVYTDGNSDVLVKDNASTCNGTETFDFQNDSFVANVTGSLYIDQRSGSCAVPSLSTNYSSIYHVSGNTCPSGTGNICSTDPQWTTSISAGAQSNVTVPIPLITSPLLGAANSALVMYSALNLDYSGLSRGTTWDIGAYQFQGCRLSANGATCSSNTTCCSGICQGGFCTSTPVCTNNGLTCSINSDCCSNVCCVGQCLSSCTAGQPPKKTMRGKFNLGGTFYIQ